jgi:hypothetical protein
MGKDPANQIRNDDDDEELQKEPTQRVIGIVPQAGLHRSGKRIIASASQMLSNLRARLWGRWKSRRRELIPRSQNEEDAQANGT